MANTSSSNRRPNSDPSAQLLSDFVLTAESTRQIVSLLRGKDMIIQQVQLGIQIATDAACDAEEFEMQDKVISLEKDLRKCIDLESQFKRQEESVKHLSDRILAGDQIKNMVDFCKIHQQELEQQDHRIPEMVRYKKNEAYLEFKQRVWDVNHKDEDMPPSGDEHSDDDIVVGRAQVSLRCPLTTVLLENPVTSKLCKHTFSEHAILQLLQQNGQPIPCPIPGCDKLISKDILSKNFVLAQKVQRVKMQMALKSQSNTDYHEVTD